jgi:hypothetical protein
MFATQRIRFWALLVVLDLALWALPNPGCAGGFSAAMLRCSAVTVPATYSGGLLATCGSDPLGSGTVTIDITGDFKLIVNKAATNTKYTVQFAAPDGSSYTPISTFMTDNHGNGTLKKNGLYVFGQSGAGNLVVTSGNKVEFVSGVSISPNKLPSGPDFEPTLVRCADVTVGAMTMPKCGTDTLNSGHALIENDSGDVTIKISGAAAKTAYTASLVSQSGTPFQLGTLSPTDNNGNGAFIVDPAEFNSGEVLSGTIELFNAGTLEFLSGFKVSAHPTPPVVSEARLVRCADSNHPILTDCGKDPLDGGSYEVDQTGKLTVKLTGPAPSVNYEAWFRPLDNSGDVDTGLAVPTNSHGDANVHSATPPFAEGDIASGTIVVKQQGAIPQPDEFVPGFVIP